MTSDMLSPDEQIKRVKRFVQMWQEKPLKAMSDNFYSIHSGSEWEADLYASDLAAVVRHIEALQAAHKTAQSMLKAAATERDAAQKRAEGLEKALRKYGEHHGCELNMLRSSKWRSEHGWNCTCGLNAALEGDGANGA